MSDLRSANLKYADVRGANLNHVKFQYAAPVNGKKAKRGNAMPACAPYCQGANLSGANLLFANLTRANLNNANLTGANLSGVTWDNTTCPNGTESSAACPT